MILAACTFLSAGESSSKETIVTGHSIALKCVYLRFSIQLSTGKQLHNREIRTHRIPEVLPIILLIINFDKNLV